MTQRQRSISAGWSALWAVAALLAGVLLGAPGCGGDSSGGNTLKVGMVLPEEHPTSQAMVYFKDRLEELSGGKITVKLFPNSQLGNADQLIDQAKSGNVEAAVVSAAPLAQHVELLNVTVMPFVFRDGAHQQAVVDGPVGDELRKAIGGKGMVGAAFFDAGSRNMMTNAGPVTRPADLSGMKIRVMGSQVLQAAVERLGASAVPMSQEEVYGALQTGLIDGWENNPATCVTYSMYEAGGKHFAWTRHVSIPDVLVFNPDWYNGLDEEARGHVDQAVADTVVKQRELWARYDAEAIDKLKAEGVTFNEVDHDAFVARMDGFYAQYTQKYGAKFTQLLEQIAQTPAGE